MCLHPNYYSDIHGSQERNSGPGSVQFSAVLPAGKTWLEARTAGRYGVVVNLNYPRMLSMLNRNLKLPQRCDASRATRCDHQLSTGAEDHDDPGTKPGTRTAHAHSHYNPYRKHRELCIVLTDSNRKPQA
jgi:hypothetical protein